jgi:hypothetical protein
VTLWRESTAGRRVQDQQHTTHDCEDQHCASQDVLCWVPLDKRRDENGTNALEGLVKSCQDPYPLEGDGDVRRLFQLVVAVGCESNNRTVESFQSKLVHHDAGDVHGNVPSLQRGVDTPCFANDSKWSEHDGCRGSTRALYDR